MGAILVRTDRQTITFGCVLIAFIKSQNFGRQGIFVTKSVNILTWKWNSNFSV